MEIVAQYMKALDEPQTDDPVRQQNLSFYKDNLRLHKIHLLDQQLELKEVQLKFKK